MTATDDFISSFTSGNCNLVAFDAPANTLHVALRPECKSLRVHSFDFDVEFLEPIDTLRVVVDNASASQYANAWAHHVPYVDRHGEWVRVESKPSYDGIRYQYDITNAGTNVETGWYEPYDLDRIGLFLEEVRIRADISDLDDDFPVLALGNADLPTVFVIARQHPGESIGSFFLEGLVDQLIEHVELHEAFHFVIVPVVNVDGVRRNLHRHDSDGINFNRSWKTAHTPREIHVIKLLLAKTKDLYLFLDVHGDEVSKINFANYAINKNATADRQRAYARLLALMVTDSPAMHVWQNAPFWKRFAKALLRQHKLISPTSVTANTFVSNTYPCMAITYEPSVHVLTPSEATAQGAKFVEDLYKSQLHE